MGGGCGVWPFDVRLATGERELPGEPEPFDPLPVCSPGMLVGDDGLPVAGRRRGIRSTSLRAACSLMIPATRVISLRRCERSSRGSSGRALMRCGMRLRRCLTRGVTICVAGFGQGSSSIT